MRAIHWPSTARRDKLMVKEFEQDPQAETWLFLDAQASVHFRLDEAAPLEGPEDILFRRRKQIKLPSDTLEYGVTLSASLAHYFIARGRAVGLVCAAQVLTVIPAERSVRQEAKILETLAFIEPAGQLSIAALAAAQSRHLPLGSSVILISPSTSVEAALAVDEFQRHRLNPIVLLLDAATFGGPSQNEALVEALAMYGIQPCLIRCGDDLPQTLAAFAGRAGRPAPVPVL